MVTDTRTDTYPKGVATVYVFNLIFGSGALFLPYAFIHVGYAIGTILFIWLAILSFVTCTYVVESMSLACAINAYNNERILSCDDDKNNTHDLLIKPDDESHNDHLKNGDNAHHLQSLGEDEALFKIQTKYELSEMARLYFNKPLLIFFFLSTIVYLYGDLLIYLSVVGHSLVAITCNKSRNSTLINEFCVNIGVINVFRIYITIFTVVVGSLVYSNVTKTKLVQYSTMCLRWLAFIVMIALASSRIAKGKTTIPYAVNLSGIPLFIGTGLYSFMCQHSLPSLLYPIKNTSRSYTSLFIYAINGVLVIYLMVTYTAAFTFDQTEIKHVYTMNFMSFERGLLYEILGYFLQLFPVVALTSSFPIVGITLRENIKALIFKDTATNTKTKFFLKRILVPAIVIYPPYIAMLFLSEHIGTIVSVVGSYAGTMVQYIIPSLLLIYGQRKAKNVFGISIYRKNFQKSPFGHIAFVSVILTWSLLGMCIVTYYNIQKIRGII